MKKAFPLFLILLAACGKDGATDDKELPVVTIATPSANQVFTGGQTVSVSASATDNAQLKQMHLEVINTTTGLVVKHEHYPVAASTYNLTQSFSVGAGNSYRVKVEADDAAGNTGKAEVLISVN